MGMAKKENEDDVKTTEEGAEGEVAESVAKPASRKKIIIVGVLAIIILMGGAAGAYFGGFIGGGVDKEHAELGPDGKPVEKAVFYTLPEFLVNLNAGGKATSTFLKTTVILEVAHKEDISKIENNLPRIIDGVNTYLRELRPSDLAGTAGIQRLREEILLRANTSLGDVKINDVLFKEIIVN
jgi:flagellar protein FliL